MVTVYPVEATGPLSNPLMGFRPDMGSAQSRYAYPTVVRHYIRWNQIENSQSDTVQKIRDFCNTQWVNLPANNQKVIPRVYIDWDSAVGNEYWPADLQKGDWSSQAFKDRVVRLIGRLGEVWDNDPRVAWVQVGIIGYWGEQENPVSVSQDGWSERLGDAFKAAFKNKKYLVRNLNHFPGYETGCYWDSFAHPSQPNVRSTIKTFNVQGRYLTQVIEGEVAYNWGESTFDLKFGGEPEITLNSTMFTDNLIDVVRELHCSALGWIASYKLDGSNGTNPDTVRTNAARLQREFGYRFLITEFACSGRTEPGGRLDVSFKVKNVGAAPFYENWPVAVVLINQSNRKIVGQVTLPGTDTRTWVPGSDYSTTSRTYQTPAIDSLITASVSVPSTLAAGEYLIGLSILEPSSGTPGVFFAVPNFFKESQSQPLCRIGIGTSASSHTLADVVFDDLVNDDTRYYTLNQAPALTTQPQSRSVVTGTSVQFSVTATGTPTPIYQWFFNGAPLTGATSTTFSLTNVRSTDAGDYTVVVSNALGSVTSQGAILNVTAHPDSPRLINVSTRAKAGSGENTLITGFIVSGNGSKTLILRGVGPRLTFYNVPEVVTDPVLALFSGERLIETNNDWDTALTPDFFAVGAFALEPGSKDSAMKVTLAPGAYTIHLVNRGPLAEALIEVYDLSRDAGTRLTNVSCRLRINRGETAILGTALSGGSVGIVVRNVGPELVSYGLQSREILPNPQLRVFAGLTQLAENDDWEPPMRAHFGAVGAFPLVEGSKDAALRVAFQPGGYTVHATGSGEPGVALIELYESP